MFIELITFTVQLKLHIAFSIYYRELVNQTNGDQATANPVTNVTSTIDHAISLKDLKSNTAYVIYVTSLNAKGESRPSETLVEWTEPIIPAYVEVKLRILKGIMGTTEFSHVKF